MNRGGQRRNRPFNNFEESMIHTQVLAGLPGLDHSDQPYHPAPHLCWKTAASPRVGVFFYQIDLARYFGIGLLESSLFVVGGFAGREGGFLKSVEREEEGGGEEGHWVPTLFNLLTPRCRRYRCI